MLCSNVNARPFIFQLIETPAIMHRAHSYLSDLETEHIQSGMLGTWRGAIPIVTHSLTPASHLPGIPEGTQEGSALSLSGVDSSLNKSGKEEDKAPSRPSTSSNGQPADASEAMPADDIASSVSLMAPFREGQEGEALPEASGTEANPSSRDGASDIHQAYVDAAAMSSQDMLPGSGPVTLPRDTLHLSALDLSISSTNPPGGMHLYTGASQHTLPGSSRRRPQSAAPRLASGRSSQRAYTLPHAASPMRSSATFEGSAEGSASHQLEADLGTEAEAPPEELTEGQHALNDSERHTLRSQLEQLQVISECVRQAGISENSGDLTAASDIVNANMWQAVATGLTEAAGPSRPGSSRPASRQQQPPGDIGGGRPASQQSQQRSPGWEEADDACYYSSDFEEDEDEMESRRIHAQWLEQQNRKAVQKQWNSEGAEAVPDDILSNPADLTPQAMSSDDEGGRDFGGPEDDRDSVEEEPISAAEFSAQQMGHGRKPDKEAQKTAAQRRLAERERKLRQRCIEGLGQATYHRLYDFLAKRAKLFSDDDDLALRIELSMFLEETQMAYWPLVDELVYFDQTRDE
mmetsp:Transcript_5124/g.14317  ORF Transcript_5124/g.14317 Transcript_5124/m.14317 type:complete len:577 (+) Transcript_5124:65-1795(+)